MTAYLVSHGRGGILGHFEAAEACERGARVIVRGPRGLEIGEVLGPMTPAQTRLLAVAGGAGQLVRPASADDEATARRREQQAARLLTDAETLLASLPVALLDAEIMLDGTRALLHVLHWATCTLDDTLAELSDRHGLSVTLLDLTHRSAPASGGGGCGEAGCGEAGCGSGGCGTGESAGGCSTGNCSRGSVKTPEELKAYFVGLREQMEATHRVPLV